MINKARLNSPMGTMGIDTGAFARNISAPKKNSGKIVAPMAKVAKVAKPSFGSPLGKKKNIY